MMYVLRNNYIPLAQCVLRKELGVRFTWGAGARDYAAVTSHTTTFSPTFRLTNTICVRPKFIGSGRSEKVGRQGLGTGSII